MGRLGPPLYLEVKWYMCRDVRNFWQSYTFIHYMLMNSIKNEIRPSF